MPLGRPDPTGILFDEQSAAAIAQAVARFDRHHADFSVDACRANAERFTTARFDAEFARVMAQALHGAIAGDARVGSPARIADQGAGR